MGAAYHIIGLRSHIIASQNRMHDEGYMKLDIPYDYHVA